MTSQSVKRTAESFGIMSIQSSASRTHDQNRASYPALKRWAIFLQSASRTKKRLFRQSLIRSRFLCQVSFATTKFNQTAITKTHEELFGNYFLRQSFSDRAANAIISTTRSNPQLFTRFLVLRVWVFG